MIQLSNLGLVLSRPPCLSCYSYHTWALSFLNCSTSLDTAIIWASLPVYTAVKPALHPFWTSLLQSVQLSNLGSVLSGPPRLGTAVKPGLCLYLAYLPLCVHLSDQGSVLSGPPCLSVYSCQTRALSFLGLPASVSTLSNLGTVLSGPPCLSLYICQSWALSFLGLPALVDSAVKLGIVLSGPPCLS